MSGCLPLAYHPQSLCQKLNKHLWCGVCHLAHESVQMGRDWCRLSLNGVWALCYVSRRRSYVPVLSASRAWSREAPSVGVAEPHRSAKRGGFSANRSEALRRPSSRRLRNGSSRFSSPRFCMVPATLRNIPFRIALMPRALRFVSFLPWLLCKPQRGSAASVFASFS